MNIIGPTPPSYIPNFLYKYTSVIRALEVLLTREVYFSHRRELNDPFDGRHMMDFSTREKREENIKKVREHEEKYHDLSSMLSGMNREENHKLFIKDKEFANKLMEKTVEDMDVFNTGVYCFTDRRDSIVMWAHYANNHQGCCLEFDLQGHVLQSVRGGKINFPFLQIHMVRYSDRYPTRVFGEERALHEENSFYMCKSKDWKYENEWRAIMYDTSTQRLISGKSIGSDIIDESIIKRMKGSGLYPLDKDLLHGIILGYKMKDNEKKSIIAAAQSSRIKIYQAQPKLYKYGMEIKPLSDFVLTKQILL